MEMLNESPANLSKLARMQAAWSATLDEALRRGFHGLVRLELMVADGTIQRIVRSVERIEK
jgi:hypothetical protein